MIPRTMLRNTAPSVTTTTTTAKLTNRYYPPYINYPNRIHQLKGSHQHYQSHSFSTCLSHSFIQKPRRRPFNQQQQQQQQQQSQHFFDEGDDVFDALINGGDEVISTQQGIGVPSANIVVKGEKDFTGMRVVFLGTSAMKPTHTRNVTAVALQLEGETWMFDCGEGTQHQCLRSGIISGISRVFISHLHGDHVMGLPGLATQLNVDRKNSPLPLEVFGPYGLRRYLYTALSSTSAQNFKRLNVSELLPRGTFDENGLYPDDNNVYHVLETDKITVKAKLILHSVPCFGWVIEEKEVPGTLNVEKCKLLGLEPGRGYRDLKEGLDIKLPDGRMIYSKDVVGEPVPGRKVVILGDTCDASSIADIAQNATMVIHESTLPDEFRKVAYSRGHACPSIAGAFAKMINAKELFITHFGGKYAIDDGFIQSVMVPQAQRAFGKPDVTAAQDFLVYNVPRVKPNKTN